MRFQVTFWLSVFCNIFFSCCRVSKMKDEGAWMAKKQVRNYSEITLRGLSFVYSTDLVKNDDFFFLWKHGVGKRMKK